jgi:NTE family protein
MPRLFSLVFTLLLLTGCSSYGVVKNAPGDGASGPESYSLETFQEKWIKGDTSLMLAFSGGGTRAAALSYGVLKAMRDTPTPSRGQTVRLLDEIDAISSVSGGSFTSAYYGLHGDGMFEDYEDVFLRQDVQGALIKRVLNPFHWFSQSGRTELAADYYEKTVFKGATYNDLQKQNGPMVVINASDLGYGVRFSFIQNYFNLLCSDLSSFPVARAVTASSAVPVLFNPVVVENYPGCDSELPDWLKAARIRMADDPQMTMVIDGLESYFQRDNRQYAHFVDGGITDNLGLRAIYEVIELAGGTKQYLKNHQRTPPRRLVLISVNASTNPEPKMDQSRKQPSLKESIGSMSNVQLHFYNVATIELMKKTMDRWARELSTPKAPVESYFILLDFKQVKDPEQRALINTMPTSFSLTDEQVDLLIETGGELLRNNPEFRRLISDLERDRQ